MRNKWCLIYILTIGLSIFSVERTFAQITLNPLISDGMVLQRCKPIEIWGWAKPGTNIDVKFDHQKKHAVAASNNKWTVTFAALKSGGPYSMQITSEAQSIQIKNILIGDVWFCSGQSNMELMMERVKEKYPQEIASTDFPEIRNFQVPKKPDILSIHQNIPGGGWVACDSKSVLNFGAVSYFFARELYLKYHVPIGIINSSLGGTPIQAWMSKTAIKGDTILTKRLTQLTDTGYVYELRRKAILQNSINPDPVTTDMGLNGSKTWYDTTYKANGWHHFWMPGYWDDQGIILNGVVWFRKEINVPASMLCKPLNLYLGRIVDADKTYVNGVLVGNTTYQYPPRRYVVAADLLKPGKNLIVVRITNFSGKGGFVPGKPYYLTNGRDTLDLRGDWLYKVGIAISPKENNTAFMEQNEPTALYNTMVAPISTYKIKGVLWYQGESNTGNPRQYKKLLPALINNWRTAWNDTKLPFIFAQLSNFNEIQYLPVESNWAGLREAQRDALTIENTGMAVTIDAGEWNDIHPLNKKVVGYRLALAAEKVAYLDDKVVYSGPLYQSSMVDSNKIMISFTNIGQGLVTKNGEELSQFTIAGTDKKYVIAHAIIKNDKVIVWSVDVPHPLYVRYAWSDNPYEANLYNKEGLPASPFTTEQDF